MYASLALERYRVWIGASAHSCMTSPKVGVLKQLLWPLSAGLAGRKTECKCRSRSLATRRVGLAGGKDAIGIAGGYPVRLSSTTTHMQELPRGQRVPIPLVKKLIRVTDGVRIIGGTPRRNGMLARLDPETLMTSNVEMVDSDCLTGIAVTGDVQVAVNGKGVLFHRKRGGTWNEQPAHQVACTGILSVKTQTFVTFGMDGLLHIWDHNCSMVGTLEGHLGGITGAALSPDGNVTTVSSDRSVRIWNVLLQRRRMFIKGFDNPLAEVHYANEEVIVIDSTGQVFTVRETGKSIRTGSVPGYPCSSWVKADGPVDVFIAQRTGMIHRIRMND